MSTPFALLPLPIAADHPAFAGHFPGHPIVPGVVLLDEAVLALAAAQGLQIDQIDVSVAKFLRPVTPGEAVSLAWRLSGPQRYVIEVRVAQTEVAATATLTVRPGAQVQGT